MFRSVRVPIKRAIPIVIRPDSASCCFGYGSVFETLGAIIFLHLIFFLFRSIFLIALVSLSLVSVICFRWRSRSVIQAPE